jgi:hypothetical protein
MVGVGFPGDTAMRHRLAIAAALLLSSALPAFAQDTAAPSAQPVAAAKPAAQDEAHVERLCLRETGTLIRPRAGRTPRRGDCPSMQAGRVYTREDLRATGEIDMADALRKLDTSIR